ncbi:DUF4349 domain-containing protein [Streptomyces termitum]
MGGTVRTTTGTGGRGRAAGAGRAGAALLLAGALALTVAGCGADGDRGANGKAAVATGGSDAAGSSGSSGSSAAPAKNGAAAPEAARQLVRTASLSLEVKEVARSAGDVRREVVAAGGRVESENTARPDGRPPVSTLVLRVPQDRYDALLDRLAGAGTLLSREASAQDVTDQVVDAQSRIATQRASVARVRALMDRAERLEDVVALESELSRRQADLEALLARQASLKDRTSLATITVNLREKERVTVPDARPEESDRPGFLDALGGGWGALVSSVAWVLVVLAALAPWLVVALAVYGVWWRFVRPRRRPRTAVSASFPAPARVPGPAAPVGAAGQPLPAGEPGAGPDGEAPAP